jgi:protoporphyrinogen oxidase
VRKLTLSDLAKKICTKIEEAGGRILTNTRAEGLEFGSGNKPKIKTTRGLFQTRAVIATTALPVVADMLGPGFDRVYLKKLRNIKYRANVCAVLELSEKTSDYYWINVSDTSMPFVGVIEHTNFVPARFYGNTHILYLSSYTIETSQFYNSSNEEIFAAAIGTLKRMFPNFRSSAVNKYHVFRYPYAQHVVECRHRYNVPSAQSPIESFFVASMAQIYPQDRGVNYAVAQGRQIAEKVAEFLEKTE